MKYFYCCDMEFKNQLDYQIHLKTSTHAVNVSVNIPSVGDHKIELVDVHQLYRLRHFYGIIPSSISINGTEINSTTKIKDILK
jgi:hypothetical protein